MGGAGFPPGCLTWGQTIVGVMKRKFPRTHCHTQDPQPCSKLLLTHTSPKDSWTRPGESGSVSCGVIVPFSWVLVHKVLFVPPRVCFPALCKFWQLYGGVKATSSKRAYATPRSAAPRAPAPAAGHSCPMPSRRHSHAALAQSPWGVWVLMCTRLVWALWACLAGKGFDSKCVFTPPTILLGLPLCLWMWDIFFLVGSNILKSMVVQQRVVVLEFL